MKNSHIALIFVVLLAVLGITVGILKSIQEDKEAATPAAQRLRDTVAEGKEFIKQMHSDAGVPSEDQ